MLWRGLTLLVGGLVIMGGGAVWAGREAGGDTMTGVWVGSGGLVVLTVGGLMVKWGLFGPLPANLQEAEA